MLHILKLPDLVTLINALCGVIAILLVLDGFTYLAPLLILVAAVADGLDGHIARKFSSSEIGSNLDSLADVISFGVAPVVITHSLVKDEMQYITLLALMFYLVCGILRLARFNTMNKAMSSFSGLPITAGGIAISSYILMGEGYFDANMMALIAVIIGILMISSIPYIKARNKTLLVALTIIFFITIMSYVVNIDHTHTMAALLTGLVTLYIISPIIKIKV